MSIFETKVARPSAQNRESEGGKPDIGTPAGTGRQGARHGAKSPLKSGEMEILVGGAPSNGPVHPAPPSTPRPPQQPEEPSTMPPAVENARSLRRHGRYHASEMASRPPIHHSETGLPVHCGTAIFPLPTTEDPPSVTLGNETVPAAPSTVVDGERRGVSGMVWLVFAIAIAGGGYFGVNRVREEVAGDFAAILSGQNDLTFRGGCEQGVLAGDLAAADKRVHVKIRPGEVTGSVNHPLLKSIPLTAVPIDRDSVQWLIDQLQIEGCQ